MQDLEPEQLEIMRLRIENRIIKEENQRLLKRIDNVTEEKHNERGAGRHPKINLNTRKEVRKMKAEGETIAEICRVMNLARNTVYKILKEE